MSPLNVSYSQILMDRLPETLSEPSRKRREAKRARRQGEFLKGPIRLEWVCQAARLSGRALAVGLALLFKAGVSGSEEDIPLAPQLLERFGVSRRSTYRALESLERAGLVKVKRHRGRCPRVTVVKGFVG